ncbi:MAG: hypothetical protein LBU89_04215 [Fibromonadaceae bacterium]|jgi:hypothetical protein|nr:hypothetical protein [Fibromonadaceae bacterium]
MRTSEQELKFLLARELEKQTEFYYSVETPTADPKGKGARSGNVDLCLHDSNKQRICFIEFKHDAGFKAIENDFIKLLCDSAMGPNYFVQIAKDCHSKTISNREAKYTKALGNIKHEALSSMKIFLYILESGCWRKYKIEKGKLKLELEKCEKTFDSKPKDPKVCNGCYNNSEFKELCDNCDAHCR